MKKKWIIALSVIVAVILLIVILSFTVFSLRSVTLDYRTSKENITATDEEIIESADIDLGGSVFFRNKQYYIDNIERENPFVKVINIETVFPSSYVIHIAERQKVFAVEHNGQYYIVDEDYKVLEIYNSEEQIDAILLNGLEISGTSYAVGEFMEVENSQPIYSALYENNRPLNEQKAMIESITFTSIYDKNIGKSQPAIELKFFSGQTFRIINSSYGLRYKVALMLDVFSQIYEFIDDPNDEENNKVDENGVILTEENLKTAIIEIRNYYDYRVYDEDDCYFQIYV